MRLQLTRRQRGDGAVTLNPVGEVDICAVGALGSAIQDTLDTPHCLDVVIDLAQVTFLDCAGIGALVAGGNTAVSRGRAYTVVTHSGRYAGSWNSLVSSAPSRDGRRQHR